MRYLSPFLSVALCAGMAGGVTVEAPIALAVTLAMSAAWVVAILARMRDQTRIVVAAVCTLVGAFGWALGAYAVDRALNAPVRLLLEQRRGGYALDTIERRSDEPVVIEGRVLGDAVVAGDSVVLRISVHRIWLHEIGETTSGGISLGLSGAIDRDKVSDWRAGRIIRAPALLRRPARYLNHGLGDQERALARRGVSLVGTIKSSALVEIVGRGYWWEELAAGARARTRHALDRHVRPYSEQSAAIATAILVGDRAGMAVETERRLQEAGTYHVIAISGGNIAVLAGLILGGLALAGVRGRAAAAACIVALSAYAVIAASGPSVLRATGMAGVYLAVRLIDQRTAAAHALALTAAAILLVNPLQIVDAGFWFTFGATAALLVAGSLLTRASPCGITKGTKGRDIRQPSLLEQARLRRAALAVLVGSICVELALAPVAAFMFQRVTLAGLVLNFAALPSMTLVQLAAMGVVATDGVGLPYVSEVVGQGVHLGSTALVESTRLLDYAPWLTWRVPSPQPMVMMSYYLCLCTALAALGVRAAYRKAAAASAVPLFLWIIVAPDARVRASGDGLLHLSMFDVGQGDSLLVTFPNGRRLLIDTGGVPVGRFDIGDRVVGPALRADRLLALDYLAITHGDADHVGGAVSLLRDFSPTEIWWGIPVAHHEPSERVRAEADRWRASWRTLQRGDELTVADVDVRLHHPPPPDWQRQRVRNNDSLVLELRFGRASFLLTGDIGHDVESTLTGALDLNDIVILKVGHHGSLTSSSAAFLRVVRPDIALIGVGRGNPYGHPAPYVIGRLQDAGAEIFRTDLDGQIDVVTDGKSVWTSTFTGRRHYLGAGRGAPAQHEAHERQWSAGPSFRPSTSR